MREVGSKLASCGRKGVLVRGLKAPKVGKRGRREEGKEERECDRNGAIRRKRNENFEGRDGKKETWKMNATTRKMNERIETR